MHPGVSAVVFPSEVDGIVTLTPGFCLREVLCVHASGGV